MVTRNLFYSSLTSAEMVFTHIRKEVLCLKVEMRFAAMFQYDGRFLVVRAHLHIQSIPLPERDQ